MAEIKMKVPVFAANRQTLQNKIDLLQMKLNNNVGPTTAETMKGYVKVIGKLNSQINRYSAELRTVGTDLQKVQENFEAADKKAADTVN